MKHYQCPNCGAEVEPYLLKTTNISVVSPDEKAIPIAQELPEKRYLCSIEAYDSMGNPKPSSGEQFEAVLEDNVLKITKGEITIYHPTGSEIRIIEEINETTHNRATIQ